METSPIMTVLRGFPQSLQANAEEIPRLAHCCFVLLPLLGAAVGDNETVVK